MTNTTTTTTETTTTADNFRISALSLAGPDPLGLIALAASEGVEFAPGRVGGRQASFDAVAAWNAVGMID
jgi:hypothetical protein